MREYNKKAVYGNAGYRKADTRSRAKRRYNYTGLLKKLKREYASKAMHSLLHPTF